MLYEVITVSGRDSDDITPLLNLEAATRVVTEGGHCSVRFQKKRMVKASGSSNNIFYTKDIALSAVVIASRKRLPIGCNSNGMIIAGRNVNHVAPAAYIACP